MKARGDRGAEGLAVDGERAAPLSPCASIRRERVSPGCAFGEKPPVGRRVASHRMTDCMPTIYGLADARVAQKINHAIGNDRISRAGSFAPPAGRQSALQLKARTLPGAVPGMR